MREGHDWAGACASRQRPPGHQSQLLKQSCLLRMLRPSFLSSAYSVSLAVPHLKLRVAQQVLQNSVACQMCSARSALSMDSLQSALGLCCSTPGSVAAAAAAASAAMLTQAAAAAAGSVTTGLSHLNRSLRKRVMMRGRHGYPPYQDPQ